MIGRRCIKALTRVMPYNRAMASQATLSHRIARSYSGVSNFRLFSQDPQNDDQDDDGKEKTFREEFNDFRKDPKKLGGTILFLLAFFGGLGSLEKVRDVLGIEFHIYEVIGIGVGTDLH
jgi:hypothetical protein